MLRKIGSFLIGLIMAVLIVLLSCLISARIFFLPSSMTSFVELMVGKDEDIDFILDDVNSELNIDEKEFVSEMGQFLSDYFRYVGGASGAKKPSTEGFKNLLKKAVDEYEKENNIEMSDSEFDEIFLEMEESLDELVNESIDEDVKLVFSIIYSDGLLLGFIISIVVCVFLDYLLRKNWLIILSHLGVVLIINFILLFLVRLLINSAIGVDVDVVEKSLIQLVLNIFTRVGFVSLALGVILIVVSKVSKKNNNNMISNNMNLNNYNMS